MLKYKVKIDSEWLGFFFGQNVKRKQKSCNLSLCVLQVVSRYLPQIQIALGNQPL